MIGAKGCKHEMGDGFPAEGMGNRTPRAKGSGNAVARASVTKASPKGKDALPRRKGLNENFKTER